MNTTVIRTYEYKNDFFYLVINEAPDLAPNTYVFSSGINLIKFDPLCWGKAGICSNPAFKGLQLLRADVSAFAIKRGIVTKNAESSTAATRYPVGHGWYRENDLVIEHAAPEAVRQILDFSVSSLVQTVLTACFPDVTVPQGLSPSQMQEFLESLYVQNYKEAAPPPIAKPNR